MGLLLRLPLILVLTGLFSLSMMVPALVALRLEEFHDARSFFYSGVLGLLITGFVGLALGGQVHNRRVLRQLVALMAAFSFLPLMLAVPFYESVRNTSFISAYFEMVSCLTYADATQLPSAELALPPAVLVGLCTRTAEHAAAVAAAAAAANQAAAIAADPAATPAATSAASERAKSSAPKPRASSSAISPPS